MLLAFAAPLTAQEKPGTNQAPPEAAAQGKSSAEADAVPQLHLAHSLIEYGRKNQAPDALITAARILAAQRDGRARREANPRAGPRRPQGRDEAESGRRPFPEGPD